MDELKEQSKGKGLAMRKSWEEMRKGGSVAPTPEAIEKRNTIYKCAVNA